MPMPAVPRLVLDSDARHVDAAARALLAGSGPIVLAISGGRDSMVLLHAVHGALQVSRSKRAGAPSVEVVTFDHGTGPAAAAAAALVVDCANRLRLPVTVGRASMPGATEAEWRAARWSFFRSVAPPGGIVATAHTRDDQVETVVMRILRSSGARGLAGLVPPASGVIRPLVGVPRATVAQYAEQHDVAYVDDPSNQSRRHLRNRVRLDLLPALRGVRPGLEAEVMELAERAARLRADLDRFVSRYLVETAAGRFFVARDELATYDSTALCVLWPAIAARAGVTLDRRGTLRLAQFTISGAPGARIQLSGGVEVYRDRAAPGDGFVFRRGRTRLSGGGQVLLAGVVDFGSWRFRPAAQDPHSGRASGHAIETSDPGGRVRTDNAWSAELPADRRLTVREWRPGDRMRAGRHQAARRVKRFFGDARIPAPTRAGWPVVLADDEIVWIPGVRRVPAAPERSGRPVVRYICERFDGGVAYS